ncbi:MAG TPA: hypothetical protein VFQ36_19140 [Ktedonobacteraceae bacterium]|nr:hypothetical protein [Ktedonobacteraceae bacterium]
MAGWQEELAELLRELGVTQEEPKAQPRSKGKVTRSDVKRRMHSRDPYADAFLDNISAASDSYAEPWETDLSQMRLEVDSIVRQVISLMQRGDLDRSLKEDVMVVLRALRRRAAVTSKTTVSDEAYLEAATSLLHFCRLVLSLSETAIEDEL